MLPKASERRGRKFTERVAGKLDKTLLRPCEGDQKRDRSFGGRSRTKQSPERGSGLRLMKEKPGVRGSFIELRSHPLTNERRAATHAAATETLLLALSVEVTQGALLSKPEILGADEQLLLL